MQLYRITKKQYLEVYTGLGGSYEDGARWNCPGTPVLYFALSASVAMLEMANYTSSPRLVPPSYRLGIYEVVNTAPIDKLERSDWPADWSEFPYPSSTQNIGDAWLKKADRFGLILPSCAIPDGLGEIMVVNPQHDLIRENQLRLIDSLTEIYNPRAFQDIGSSQT